MRGGRGNGFCFADPVGEPAVEGPERGLGAAETHGREAKDRRGAIGGGLRARAEEPPAGDLVPRREGEPGGEVVGGGPAVHVGPDFSEQPERRVRADALDLREIDAGEVMQWVRTSKRGSFARGFCRGRAVGRGVVGAIVWFTSVVRCASIAWSHAARCCR